MINIVQNIRFETFFFSTFQETVWSHLNSLLISFVYESILNSMLPIFFRVESYKPPVKPTEQPRPENGKLIPCDSFLILMKYL